jgi:hypothetical protein
MFYSNVRTSRTERRKEVHGCCSMQFCDAILRFVASYAFSRTYAASPIGQEWGPLPYPRKTV